MAFTADPFFGKTYGVTTSKLSKVYGSLSVLNEINLEVKKGEIFCIMGPSGSGKTVLMKQIAGLERPTIGKVRIGEFDPAEPETRKKIRLTLVFQAGALFNSLSVYDNLALYLREHRIDTEKGIRERVMHTLSMFSLEKVEKKFPYELSGGMRKLTAIARSIIIEPQLLLYDEPTSELDPMMAATISEIIATLRKKTAVTSIVVTHDRALALNIADRIAIIMNGSIKAVSCPANLKEPKDPAIAKFLNPTIDTKNPHFRHSEPPS